MSPNGNFVVSWESGSDDTNYDIYARWYANTAAVNYASYDISTFNPVTGLPFPTFPEPVYGVGTNLIMGTNPLYGPNGEMGGEVLVNSTTDGNQRFPSVALDDAGDAVVVWSGNGELAGQVDAQGIFSQRFAQANDTAPPTVSEVLNAVNVSGTNTVKQIADSAVVDTAPTKLVVTFGENLSTQGGASGPHSVLNLANWQIALNGKTVSGGIVSVQYGLNEAYILGLESQPSNKYEAVLTLDGDLTTAGNQALAKGSYILTIKDPVQDLFGNNLDGNYDGIAGGNYNLKFTVAGTSGDDNTTPPGDPTSNVTDIIVNSSTTGMPQSTPDVATDSKGNYVVVWVTYNANEEGDIHGQRFDHSGKPIGSEFVINTYTTGSQIEPSVAMDSFGDFVVVWSGPGSDDDAGVFAQIYDKNGNAVNSQFRVNQYAQNIQDMPKVAMDANGDFVVAWDSYGQDGDKDGIFARRFNVQGTALTDEFQVNTTYNFRQENPDIGMDSNGDFVVVWESDQQDGSMFGIFGQRFTATGTKAGSEFAVNTYTFDKQVLPAVDMDATGDFVVTWESFNQAGSTSGYDIYARRYNAAGTAKDSAEFRVNQTTLNWQVTPDVGMADNGDFTITWSSFGQDNVDSSNSSPTSDYGIYARMYKADGSDYVSPTTSHALGEFRVNALRVGDQITPAISVTPSGNAVIVWAGPLTKNNHTDQDVFARLISASTLTPTNTQGPTISGVAVVPASGFMSWNAVDPDGVAGKPQDRRREHLADLRPLYGALGCEFRRQFRRARGRHPYLHHYGHRQDRQRVEPFRLVQRDRSDQ